MFSKNYLINLKDFIRKNTLENSLFIQEVWEGDRRDKMLEDVFMRSSEENPYHKNIQANIKLCHAIQEEKRKNFVDEKRELQQRTNVESLKQLETNIRAAYTSKAIAAQNFEHEALKEEEKAKVCLENIQLEEARLREDAYAKKLEEDKRQQQNALKRDLQEQMAITNAKRQQEKINLMKEKQMMDNAVKKYKEDMMQEARKSHEKKLRARTEMEEFKRADQKLKMTIQIADNKESEQAAKLLKQRELDLQKAQQEKRDRQDRKNKISAKIGEQNHAEMEKQHKAFDILTELLIDERKAKEEMKQLLSQERAKRERIAIRNDLNKLMQEKQRRKLEEKKMDEQCYQEIMLELAKHDKLQQLSDEKKMKQILEHRQALQNALSEQKRARARDMKKHITANLLQTKEVIKGQQRVEMARMNMLKEHAPALSGYLPLRLLHPKERELLITQSK